MLAKSGGSKDKNDLRSKYMSKAKPYEYFQESHFNYSGGRFANVFSEKSESSH